MNLLCLLLFTLPQDVNILFTLPGCPPCKVAKLRLKNEDVQVIDANKESELADKYNITAVPVLVIIRGGEVKEIIRGLKTKKEYKEILNKYSCEDCDDCKIR